MEVKDWLITGGCGFIGSSLVAHLLAENPNAGIRLLDNLSVGSREELGEVASFKEVAKGAISGPPHGVELFVGDIKDVSACREAATGVDTVVHLAANTGVEPSVKNPRLDMETNVLGTFNMLEAALKQEVGKFVMASSGAPLGEVTPPIHERKAPRPVSPYGASKLAGEGYCSAFYRTVGLKTIALRFGNVYGPRSKNKSSVVAKFFKLALKGETLEIYGDGSQTRDFIYVEDLMSAITLSARAEIGGEVFQIATHRETTVKEIADKISELLLADGIDVKVVHAGERLGDVKRNFSDISKARKMLGYEPGFDLERGLKVTFGYFKRQAVAGRVY